ncbi:MFS transporter [Novosphingobium rosa]|uniref:hypothetical protein n=1 Tax=Novosphingobium rosa TaxID=76978 RepID=UPI0008346A94|nr:hypothetical protein [Novosphingobium rosa]
MPRPTPSDTPISLTIGGLGLTSLGLQPQIVDAATGAGLDAGLAGLLSTLEIGMMGLASILMLRGALGAIRKALLIPGAALMALGNALAGAGADIVPIMIGRGMAGIGEGLLASVGVAVVIASKAPVRDSARFIACSAVPQLLCCGILSFTGGLHSAIAMPLLLLVGTGVVALWPILALAVPRAVQAGPSRRPSPPALAALLLLVMLNAVGSACWTYLGALGQASGLSPALITACLTASLVTQIAASLLLGWREPKHRLVPLLMLVLAAQTAASLCLPLTASGPAYLAGAAAFGFTWQAGLPLATGLFRQSDPQGSASFLALPATLLGIAVGPGAAGLLTGADTGPAPTFFLSAMLLAATGAGLTLLGLIAKIRSPQTCA